MRRRRLAAALPAVQAADAGARACLPDLWKTAWPDQRRRFPRRSRLPCAAERQAVEARILNRAPDRPQRPDRFQRSALRRRAAGRHGAVGSADESAGMGCPAAKPPTGRTVPYSGRSSRRRICGQPLAASYRRGGRGLGQAAGARHHGSGRHRRAIRADRRWNGGSRFRLLDEKARAARPDDCHAAGRRAGRRHQAARDVDQPRRGLSRRGRI